jgi:heme-degrading monooxygenase HmoA
MSETPAPTPDDGGPAFAAGQVVTVFRSRVRPEAIAEYGATAPVILELALGMPGLVDVKSFSADDGEHVTIATFADEESQRAWREHAEHRAAQRAGRDRFYSGYSIQVCETVRARSFTAAEGVQR